MTTLPKVYIILLNYNRGQDTIECIESLIKVKYQNYKIVVVDNNSPDTSMNKIKQYIDKKNIPHIFFKNSEESMKFRDNIPFISLIQSGYNGGYAYGNNIGIKFALSNRADYISILNNDTIVDSEFLKPMVDICENDKTVGIVGGKILFYDRQDIIWFNGGKFYPLIGRVKHFNFCEKDIGQTPPEHITFMTGCMMLISRKTIENVGFLNEKYFMYVEDLEYSQRVLKNGYKLKICQNSRVWHKVESNINRRLTKFSTYFTAKNKIKFIKDNLTFFYKITSFLYITIIFSIRFIYKKRSDLLKSHLRGIIDAF